MLFTQGEIADLASQKFHLALGKRDVAEPA
jgi:hypothetical protein